MQEIGLFFLFETYNIDSVKNTLFLIINITINFINI